ncbi:MAG: hypothetical protein ACJAXJ_002171 [Colwellia sp.]
MLNHETLNNERLNLKLNRHPFKWVLDNFKNQFNELEKVSFNFSEYTYLPRTIKDERHCFTEPLENLNIDYLTSLLYRLNSNKDLAMHSIINIDSKKHHLPMIDFGMKNISDFSIPPIKKFIEYWNMDFAIFNSGRSFHAYGTRLLSEDEWIKFMGSLLLLNEPGGRKVIDTRWIGHRILAGYSALRLSCNSSQYKTYPKTYSKDLFMLSDIINKKHLHL